MGQCRSTSCSTWRARRILGPGWLENYVARANAGGIERVLV
jgi:hypothetical protein